MEVGVIQACADEDFEKLWQMVGSETSWKLEYQYDNNQVWSKHSCNGELKMIKVKEMTRFLKDVVSTDHWIDQIQAKTVFEDVDLWLLFDVLMDGEYRALWDTHMLESYSIGFINPNNDVGYYASMFPTVFV